MIYASRDCVEQLEDGKNDGLEQNIEPLHVLKVSTLEGKSFCTLTDEIRDTIKSISDAY